MRNVTMDFKVVFQLRPVYIDYNTLSKCVNTYFLPENSRVNQLPLFKVWVFNAA